jgi:hypothetical protein
MILQRQLPWLKAGILKTRNAASADKKRGQLIFGEKPDGKINTRHQSEGGTLMTGRHIINQKAKKYKKKNGLENRAGFSQPTDTQCSRYPRSPQ